MAQDTIKSSKDAEEELLRDALLNYDYQRSLRIKAALYKALIVSLNLYWQWYMQRHAYNVCLKKKKRTVCWLSF